VLTFTLYAGDDYNCRTRQVSINPVYVASVEEAERRPALGNGWAFVAVVTMADGRQHVVCDTTRRVARQIAEAQEAAAAH
jgi:hypothetical protein